MLEPLQKTLRNPVFVQDSVSFEWFANTRSIIIGVATIDTSDLDDVIQEIIDVCVQEVSTGSIHQISVELTKQLVDDGEMITVSSMGQGRVCVNRCDMITSSSWASDTMDWVSKQFEDAL
jgi:hypothetical protein